MTEPSHKDFLERISRYFDSLNDEIPSTKSGSFNKELVKDYLLFKAMTEQYSQPSNDYHLQWDQSCLDDQEYNQRIIKVLCLDDINNDTIYANVITTKPGNIDPFTMIKDGGLGKKFSFASSGIMSKKSSISSSKGSFLLPYQCHKGSMNNKSFLSNFSGKFIFERGSTAYSQAERLSQDSVFQKN